MEWLLSHDSHCIIVEDGRDIFRREFVGSVRDEQARLSDGTVTNDDTPTQVSLWCYFDIVSCARALAEPLLTDGGTTCGVAYLIVATTMLSVYFCI